jgi:putative membrane protein
MLRRVLGSTTFVALCAAALVAGCTKSEKSADSMKVDTSAMAPPAAVTPPPAPVLTDVNIVAILDHANMADSSNGAIAATKGTHADVKSFGKTMERDHHALRKAGEELAKKNNITPAMPADDKSVATDAAFHDSLNAMPKGEAFDKAYIDHEVAYHEAVLATAQTALGAAQNAELKALITKAAPNIQGHLDKAKAIQAKLAGAGAGGGAMPDTTKKKKP